MRLPESSSGYPLFPVASLEIPLPFPFIIIILHVSLSAVPIHLFFVQGPLNVKARSGKAEIQD
jgi:hypothetical protein